MYAGKKILVVDDEPDLREILRDEFVAAGAEVIEASNGVEALAKVRSEKFDLVVSDIRMPGGDGVTFARTMKAENPLGPAIVLITGFADLLPEEAYDLGAEVFHQKPFPLDSLLKTLEKYLACPKARFIPSSGNTVLEDSALTLKNVTSIHEASSRGQFLPGRGGAFVRADNFSARLGSRVDVQFPENILFQGFVRWNRQDRSSHLPRGFGMEFEILNPEAQAWYDAWQVQNKPIAYIPRR